MAKSRDNFSKEVVRLLGSRVAYRCCYPGCGVLTIGPNTIDDSKALILGEAAHIYGASPGGPRYDPKMTPDERRAVSNGIWMCRHHARLIDADEGNYSAETIQQWKEQAEGETYRQLKELTKATVPEPTTIICLHPKLMFEGVWAGAKDDTWRFIVRDFIYGDRNVLREFQVSRTGERKNYIIIESQGDGRLIRDTFEWKEQSDTIEIAVQVFPSAVRRNPDFIGTAPAYPIELDNGRVRMVSGRELAVQKIKFLLNENQGSRMMNRSYGTLFGSYYRDHNDNLKLLNRLVKVELTRLIAIPTNPEQPAGAPELNFINRIHEVRISKEADGKVSVWLSLEWGDGSLWEGIVIVYIENIVISVDESLPAVKLVRPQAEKAPLDQLRTLTASLEGEELRVKNNEASQLEIFRDVLPLFMNRFEQLLKGEIYPMFHEYLLSRTYDHYSYDFNTSYDLELHLLKRGMVHEMGVHVALKGFKKAGIQAFDIHSNLYFWFNDYNYTVGISQAQPRLAKMYNQRPSETEVEMVANDFINRIILQINEQILKIQS